MLEMGNFFVKKTFSSTKQLFVQFESDSRFVSIFCLESMVRDVQHVIMMFHRLMLFDVRIIISIIYNVSLVLFVIVHLIKVMNYF